MAPHQNLNQNLMQDYIQQPRHQAPASDFSQPSNHAAQQEQRSNPYLNYQAAGLKTSQSNIIAFSTKQKHEQVQRVQEVLNEMQKKPNKGRNNLMDAFDPDEDAHFGKDKDEGGPSNNPSQNLNDSTAKMYGQQI